MTNLPFEFEKPQDSPGFLLWQATTLWQRQIKKPLSLMMYLKPSLLSWLY